MSVWLPPVPYGWEDLVSNALCEDIGTGDVSAANLPHGRMAEWYIEAQGSGVVCGLGIVESLMQPTEDNESISFFARDGDEVVPSKIVAKGVLAASDALQYERTALNFLMHMSGVATATHQFVEKVEGTKARIVDTRKTLPGLRLLQKYAVRCGGGANHRMGLYDAVMIKDNHIQAHGSITNAVTAVRSGLGHMIKIEIECETEDQVREALQSRCEVVMLDNMVPAEMAQIVHRYAGQAVFEASGGVNLETVREIAETGVDVISVGSITHSVPSLSFHMELS
ncbi:MAG: carboxylating nicotinate-nucleotide diphosphorylase [Armatimonadetes bacterium]|nr:carboxylating nicotinate-nucleotide diphosphorylase [Armatimonadota bacterium]MBS1701754.1 carboxylating nicotinate-nucleotide diphosphorylase [Armatimonadota bacterium]MBS1728696.1 carboxylating nicotinate-nucleotide diphosphorylase [Armatimonadota bacterium]